MGAKSRRKGARGELEAAAESARPLIAVKGGRREPRPPAAGVADRRAQVDKVAGTLLELVRAA